MVDPTSRPVRGLDDREGMSAGHNGASYQFGEFRLDTRAREMWRRGEPVPLALTALDCLIYLIEHRDRPVGRDELISAVWGRAELSESTLAHTIVRLRQVVGDDGREQRSIRTVARLGYRWVAEVVAVEGIVDAGLAPVEDGSVSAPDAGETATATDSAATFAPVGLPESNGISPPSALPEASVREPLKPAVRRPLLILAGVLVLTALLALALIRREPVVPAELASGLSALVLPVEVDASADWAWLRLGLMDLVGNRLRQGGLATVPSETALLLLQQADAPLEQRHIGIGVQIQPFVTAHAEGWQVRLIATTQAAGEPLEVEATAENVIAAGKRAADELLIALGYRPPGDTLAGPQGPDELLQRIAAARLAGRIDSASNLLNEAPPEWLEIPRIALVRARVDCDRGEWDICQQQLNALKAGLSRSEDPALLGEVLVSQGWLHANRSEFEAARQVLDEAVELLREGGTEVAVRLGYALELRAWLSQTMSRFDAAIEDLSQARQMFARGGDIRGIAIVDRMMGVIASRRGQMGLALTLLEASAAQLEALGAEPHQAIALMALSEVQSLLLEHPAALATTERFWLAEEVKQDRGRAGYRAAALLKMGRLGEAESLAKWILAEGVRAESERTQGDAQALLAQIASERGQPQEALRLAKAASHAFGVDRGGDLANRMVLIRSLHELGDLAAARREVEQLRAWAASHEDVWLKIGAALMTAEQAHAEGDLAAALEEYTQVMASAEQLGVPEWLAAVGFGYVAALQQAGRHDDAQAVAGRLGPWTDKDLRAAWTQVRLLHDAGDPEALRMAMANAIRLAGERRLPALAANRR